MKAALLNEWFAACASISHVLKLTAATADDIEVDPTNALASIELQTDGDLVFQGNASPSDPADEWISPKTGFSSSDYECRMEQLTGDPLDINEGLDAWLTINQARTWGYLTAAVEVLLGTFTLRVRKIGDAGSEVNATMTIRAERSL